MIQKSERPISKAVLYQQGPFRLTMHRDEIEMRVPGEDGRFQGLDMAPNIQQNGVHRFDPRPYRLSLYGGASPKR